MREDNELLTIHAPFEMQVPHRPGASGQTFGFINAPKGFANLLRHATSHHERTVRAPLPVNPAA